MIVNEGRPGGTKLPALTTPGAAADLLSGKQLINQNGEIVTGTMANRGNVSQSLNAGGSYTIPAGYHSGGGKVTANSLASQTSGTATAADIRSGKTAWVNGARLTGTGQMAGEVVSFGFLPRDSDCRYHYVITDQDSYRFSGNGAQTCYCTIGSLVTVVLRDGSDQIDTIFDFTEIEWMSDNADNNFDITVLRCDGNNGSIRINW